MKNRSKKVALYSYRWHKTDSPTIPMVPIWSEGTYWLIKKKYDLIFVKALNMKKMIA